jgi:uncharacterized membrane protein HdeD (DUF308 family)
MNKVTERFNKMMFASMGIFALDILVGLLFFVCDTFTDRVSCVILGSLILVHGLFFMIRYIYDGLGRKVFALDVIFGVAAIIFGLFTIFVPTEFISNYLLLFGIGLCILGLEMFSHGIVFMKKREEIFPLVTSTGVLIIIMGIVAIINPFKDFVLTFRLVTYFAVATGVFGCSCSNLFKRRTRAILDMYK